MKFFMNMEKILIIFFAINASIISAFPVTISNKSSDKLFVQTQNMLGTGFNKAGKWWQYDLILPGFTDINSIAWVGDYVAYDTDNLISVANRNGVYDFVVRVEGEVMPTLYMRWVPWAGNARTQDVAKIPVQDIKNGLLLTVNPDNIPVLTIKK